MISIEDFEGRWTLSRRIEDRRAGQFGTFEGQVDLTPGDGPHWRYREVGTLQMGQGPVMQAERRYLWQQDGRDIIVFFDDGRDFHRFCPEGSARDDHLCGEDFYRVSYEFAHWPEWCAVWTVTGPRKEYIMTSRYVR